MTRAEGRALPRGAGPALVALTACLVCYAAGWRGTDWAAQLYRASQVAHHGFAVWDPGWYGGTFPLNYSVVYPLAAGYLGLWPIAAVSAAGAALGFDRLVSVGTGRPPAASWYFAVSTVIEVAIGQLPTLAGEALALGCLVCLARDRERGVAPPRAQRAGGAAGLALGLLAGLTSPVVGSFLALCLCAWGASGAARAPVRTTLAKVAAGAAVFAAAAVPPLVFPSPGYFPFGTGDLVVVLAICAVLASPWLRSPRPVQMAAVLYALASVGLFVVRTQMGDNDARFGAYIGVPLVIYYLPRSVKGLAVEGRAGGRFARRRWLATAVGAATAGCLVLWHWSPIAEAVGGPADGPSSVASFYQPLLEELGALTKGSPARVEIPPTAHHWESAYVAGTFPLARGWERQLDMAYDELFYRPGPLPPDAYRAWLVSNGVSYVALADAPLDYAATTEAAVLRSGTALGLVPVWHRGPWKLWKVEGSSGLAGAPARVTSVGPGGVALRFSAPGSIVVKMRWSRYWSLSGGPRRATCLTRSAGGWTEVSSAVPAVLELTIAVLGAHRRECSPSAGPQRPYDQGVDG